MAESDSTRPTPATGAGPRWSEYDIHTERTGNGPTLVLTHGFGDSSEAWAAVMPELAAAHTVVRWDLLGHGRSAKPDVETAYHRDRAVAELARIIEEHAPPVVLVGHSVGGYLSQCLALRRPDLVRGLVLLDTGPGYRNPASRQQWNERARAGIDRYDVPFAAWRLLEQHDSFVMDHLDQLAAPTLVVCGAEDAGYVNTLGLYARKCPGAETLVIAGARHNPHKTHGDAVVAAIRAFCERRL